jgi:hypothetical protein
MSSQKFVDKQKIVRDLVSMQLPHVAPHRRLLHKDLRRIAKYIDSPIASDDQCCIWKGYVTNTKNSRGSYINFFFRNKKVAFHRLIYENFKGPIDDNHYIKFTCEKNEEEGTCCNVNHMIKYKYNTKYCEECVTGNETQQSNNVKQPKKKNTFVQDNLADKITLSLD